MEMKTQIIGEFKQQDGWHAVRIFDRVVEARTWTRAVDESCGHHHARRFRRVKIGSNAWQTAIEKQAQTD